MLAWVVLIEPYIVLIFRNVFPIFAAAFFFFPFPFSFDQEIWIHTPSPQRKELGVTDQLTFLIKKKKNWKEKNQLTSSRDINIELNFWLVPIGFDLIGNC